MKKTRAMPGTTKDGSSKKISGISDESVKKRTGRTWSEWLRILDDAGGKAMSHKDIVAHLKSRYDISPWWQQAVTVGYEQARGLRDKHEMPEGYQIGKSKTINVSAVEAFSAWKDGRKRKRWLDEPVRVRKATEPRTLRITWSDGSSHLDVYLNAKGAGKTQVVVNHSKLPDANTAEQMKAYWGDRLAALKTILEA